MDGEKVIRYQTLLCDSIICAWQARDKRVALITLRVHFHLKFALYDICSTLNFFSTCTRRKISTEIEPGSTACIEASSVHTGQALVPSISVCTRVLYYRSSIKRTLLFDCFSQLRFVSCNWLAIPSPRLWRAYQSHWKRIDHVFLEHFRPTG